MPAAAARTLKAFRAQAPPHRVSPDIEAFCTDQADVDPTYSGAAPHPEHTSYLMKADMVEYTPTMPAFEGSARKTTTDKP